MDSKSQVLFQERLNFVDDAKTGRQGGLPHRKTACRALCTRVLIAGTICYGVFGADAQGPATTQVPVSSAGVRTWTSVEGKLFQASLVSFDGSNVVMRLPNGQSGPIALARLSPADRLFVTGAFSERAVVGTDLAPVTSKGRGKPLPVEKRTWPAKVEVDTRSIEVSIVGAPASGQDNIYHSRSFEFVAQDKIADSVMTEVARTFEATRSLVEALPWGVDTVPPKDLGYYQAKLYKDRKGYVADGGPEHSGGVYFPKDRIFRVPFESLGLEMRGKTWFKNKNYRNSALVHEVTHQMMHDFLPFLPVWVTEGTAEYSAMLPYNAGFFPTASHEKGLKEYLRIRGGIQDIGSPMELLKMTHAQWHARADEGGKEQMRLYVGACTLVYFFSHLDGDGKGTDFIRYMQRMREAQDAWAEFFQNPKVEHFPDGRYRYPQGVNPPAQEYSEKTGLEASLDLLNGRDEEAFKKAFSEGYKKIGIR